MDNVAWGRFVCRLILFADKHTLINAIIWYRLEYRQTADCVKKHFSRFLSLL